ncbi:hypothetical protein M9C81_03900 [SAR86 cluster bacterium]|nr:hypothetical protein M9C81_03900 [SAR86 cluster bacterium]
MKLKLLLPILFVVYSCSQDASINRNDLIEKAGAPLLNGLGSHSFTISSKVEGVQEYFNQGLIMAFAFNHAESIRSFKAAQKLDPNCAICLWGEALALGPNINVTSDGNAIMSPQDRLDAFERTNKAIALIEFASPKEKDFILTLKSRYNGDVNSSRVPLDIAYAEAMEALSSKYPDDTDAASLYAEALMNTMPWNYWAEDGNPKPDTIKVINTIESVLDKDPNHPLAIHLYIHAVEASSDPGRAEEAADRLADLVPGAGHLVHMPSHIYWRVGRYEDASLANIAAAKVDEEYIAQCNAQGFYPALYYPHNVHFLWAASTMEGMSDLSIESAIKVSNYVSPEQIRNIPFLEFFHTIPLLSYVRFAKWDKVFSYERPDEDFKFSNSIFNYALSVAHAANGNSLEANRFQSMILNDIESEEVNAMVMAGHPTKSLMKIASLLASGSIDMYSSKYSEAITSFKEAVIIQDTLPYTEPPFWYYPTRQTLGHALLMNNSFEEAALVFEKDLKDYPRNGWSYFGLHLAQNKLNNQEESIEALNKFKEIWGRADISINSSIVY